MKKIMALFLSIALMLLTGCGSTAYRYSSQVEETLTETPYVSRASSCSWGSARGKYNVSATGYGTLCTGNGYSDKGKAIANPLEIQSAGYEIVVTIADETLSSNDVETVTMTAGDAQLISCESGSFNGYLFIVVSSSLETESPNATEAETEIESVEAENEIELFEEETVTETPYVSRASSCSWGSARGNYNVLATGYGTLCTGNGYSDKGDAIANPLEIQSAGYEIVVTVADETLTEDSIETVTMTAGDAQLVSCKSGSFRVYLYVIVV